MADGTETTALNEDIELQNVSPVTTAGAGQTENVTDTAEKDKQEKIWFVVAVVCLLSIVAIIIIVFVVTDQSSNNDEIGAGAAGSNGIVSVFIYPRTLCIHCIQLRSHNIGSNIDTHSESIYVSIRNAVFITDH